MFHKEQILFLANHILSFAYGSKPKSEPRSILVVKMDEIGDVMCALPAINALIAAYPKANIDVLCKPYCTEIFKCIPGINAILDDDSLWDKKYDWVAELRGTWKTFFKSIKYKPKFRFNRGTTRLKNKGKQKHEIATNFDIFSSIQLANDGGRVWEIPHLDKEAFQNYRLSHNLGKYAVLHASARRVLRKWKPENFKQLSLYLWNKHQIKSVYIGVESEGKQIQEITSDAEEYALNASGVFSIPALAELVNHSLLFIGNESGPLQLADYLDKPSLSFFGPGVTHVFYPQNKNSQILHYVLECNPCDQIHCVQKIPCIDRIELLEAKTALDKIIEKLSTT